MARAPEHRYDSAADLRAALLAAGAAPTPRPTSPPRTSPPAPAAPPASAAAGRRRRRRPRPRLRSGRPSAAGSSPPSCWSAWPSPSASPACSSAAPAPATSSAASRTRSPAPPSPAPDRASSDATAFDPFGDDQQENGEDADNVRHRRRPRHRVDDPELRQPRHHGAQAGRGPRPHGRAARRARTSSTLDSPTNDWTASFYVAPTATPATFEALGRTGRDAHRHRRRHHHRRPRRHRRTGRPRVDHRPRRRQRGEPGHDPGRHPHAACPNSLAASLPRPTTRRWSAPPSRAMAPPSTRSSGATTTASTRCAGAWPATRPTPSTPPRRR